MKLKKDKENFILDFRFRDKRFRLTAFKTRIHSQRLADTIDLLIDVYESNDVIRPDLQRAIDCMPLRLVKRLGKIGYYLRLRQQVKID